MRPALKAYLEAHPEETTSGLGRRLLAAFLFNQEVLK
jgi:hypothetical protein